MSDAWKTIRIGDWGEVRGGRQRSPHLTAGRNRPYLRVANVFDGFIDTSDILEMPFTDVEFEQYLLQPGDILINEGQSSELVGRSAVFRGPGNCYAFQNTLIRFRAGPDCEPQFAHELFRTLWRNGTFQRIAKQTTSIAHLGVSRFSNLRVRVPPLALQRRVAAALCCFNDVVRMLQRIVELKRDFKRGLLEQLVSGERRFPAFASAPRRRFRLDQIASRRREVAPVGEDQDTPCVDLEHIVAREGRLTGLTATSQSGTRMRFAAHDVLVGKLRPYLRKYALPTFAGACSSEIWVLRAHHETVMPEYLFALVQSELIQGALNVTSGSKMPRADWDVVARSLLSVPSLEEQNLIATTLAALAKEVLLLERESESYLAQKDALMHRLLSGDIPALDPAA